MGKIKIKTLGVEDEEKLKSQEKEKREQKKLRKLAETKKAGPAYRQAGKVNLERKAKKEAVSEVFEKENKERLDGLETPTATTPPEKKVEKKEKMAVEQEIKEEIKPTIPKKRSQAYRNAAKLIDHNKLYPIEQVIDLVKQTSYSKFVGTVEVHINCLEKGLKASVTLPHGTGKERKVAVASDEIIKELAGGKINFDALVATPDFMPKLAKYAKFLGTKGLMPNPKAGTVTANPEKIVAELKAGRMDLKTESSAPIIHTIIGKVDFDKQKLVENFNKLTETIGRVKIKSVFVKATMGPSIKVALG